MGQVKTLEHGDFGYKSRVGSYRSRHMLIQYKQANGRRNLPFEGNRFFNPFLLANAKKTNPFGILICQVFQSQAKNLTEHHFPFNYIDLKQSE